MLKKLNNKKWYHSFYTEHLILGKRKENENKNQNNSMKSKKVPNNFHNMSKLENEPEIQTVERTSECCFETF